MNAAHFIKNIIKVNALKLIYDRVRSFAQASRITVAMAFAT